MQRGLGNIYLKNEVDPSALPLKAGLELWLDASYRQSFTLGSGNRVSQWADRRGNGLSAAQGTATQQPVLAPLGITGLPAVRFDGFDDALPVTNMPTIDTVTYYFVAYIKSLANNATLFTRRFSTNYAEAMFMGPANYNVFIGRGVANYATYNMPHPLLGQPHVFTYVWNAATLRPPAIYINGLRHTLLFSGSAGNLITGPHNADLDLGHNIVQGTLDGSLSEVLVYSQAHTGTLVWETVKHLRSKWNI